MSLLVPCPRCGPRPQEEFTFGGELRALPAEDVDDFARVYLRENTPGPQWERWYHAFGCRRWVTLARDTVTNRIDPGVTQSGG